MEEIVFLNGKYMPLKEAGVPVSDPGFLLGYGVFETMRSFNNKIVRLREHLVRLKNSCGLLGIDLNWTLPQLQSAIQKTCALNGFNDTSVRLTLWRAFGGTGVLILAKKYIPYPVIKYKTGFSAGISSFSQDEKSFLAGIKTTNRILYKLSDAQARAKKFDEAVILNNKGYICEGTRTNIFFVKDKEMFTPSLECGCLDGITRGVIFDLAKQSAKRVLEGQFTPFDLYSADEAFLTNSLMGVMPLTRLGDKLIGTGKPGRVTGIFVKGYGALLRGKQV